MLGRPEGSEKRDASVFFVRMQKAGGVLQLYHKLHRNSLPESMQKMKNATGLLYLMAFLKLGFSSCHMKSFLQSLLQDFGKTEVPGFRFFCQPGGD